MVHCSRKKCSKGSRKGRDGRCHRVRKSRSSSRRRSSSLQRCHSGFVRSKQHPYGCIPHQMMPVDQLVPCDEANGFVRKDTYPRQCVKKESLFLQEAILNGLV